MKDRICEMLMVLGLPCGDCDVEDVEKNCWSNMSDDELEQICLGNF